MKRLHLILLFLLPLFQSAKASGISWGSDTGSVFRDSYGYDLNETFHVQLGFFADVLGEAFVPDAGNNNTTNTGNVANWVTQWRVFDEASINLNDAGNDYFTSEAWVGAGGESYANIGSALSPIWAPNPDADDLGLNSFAGQTAYIWLYNSKTPSLNTQWFLARLTDWTFPESSDDCCETTPNLQWSVSQLADGNVVPVWGAQSGQIGKGHYTDINRGAYELQTFTFIPEPSSLLMAVFGSSLLLRRRRDPVVLSA